MISAVWFSYRLFKQVFVNCRFLKSKISECVCTPSKFLCFFWFRRLEFTIQDCLKAIEAFLTNCDYLLISTFGLWNTFELKYSRICIIMHNGYFLTINGKITLSEYFYFDLISPFWLSYHEIWLKTPLNDIPNTFVLSFSLRHTWTFKLLQKWFYYKTGWCFQPDL